MNAMKKKYTRSWTIWALSFNNKFPSLFHRIYSCISDLCNLQRDHLAARPENCESRADRIPIILVKTL